MERPSHAVATTTAIFGLRYLEEEDAEINGIAGCTAPVDETLPGQDGDPWEPTHYVTNCDYTDSD